MTRHPEPGRHAFVFGIVDQVQKPVVDIIHGHNGHG